MSSGRESAATATASRWAPELATLRALARDAAEQLQLPSARVAGGMSASASSAAAGGRDPTAARQPASGRRGREMDHGKTAKVMHLLLWGPK